eukprot:6318408-Pyramimonas_sp.AAC.1
MATGTAVTTSATSRRSVDCPWGDVCYPCRRAAGSASLGRRAQYCPPPAGVGSERLRSLSVSWYSCGRVQYQLGGAGLHLAAAELQMGAGWVNTPPWMNPLAQN